MTQSDITPAVIGSETSLPSRENRALWPSFRLHVIVDFKNFWRSLITLAFIVAMPVMFYVGFGFAFRSEGKTILTIDDHTLTQANYSFAGVLTFGLMSVAFANVAIGLAIRRHQGLFKRLRTTPARPLVVMSAYLVNALMTTLIVVAAVSAIGTLLFGVHIGGSRVVPLLAIILGGFLATAPLGAALSLVPPSEEAAVPIVNGLFFPMAFLSGAFFQVSLGGVVDAVVGLLPGKQLMLLFVGAVSSEGPVWDARAALVLAAWGIAGAVVFLRFFKWESEREPRASSRRRGSGAASDD